MLPEKGPSRTESLSVVVVGQGKEEMGMASLSAAMKNRITDVLDSAHLKQHDFTVKYDDDSNPMVTITFLGYPEYRFVINSTHESAFTTSECPGIHSEAAETFQRSNFELCVDAIKEWVERVVNKQKDWILDEFGGVADRDPS